MPRSPKPRVVSHIFDYHAAYLVEAFSCYAWRIYGRSLPITIASNTLIHAGAYTFKFIPEGIRISCKEGSAILLYHDCCANKTTGAIYGDGAPELLRRMNRVAASFIAQNETS